MGEQGERRRRLWTTGSMRRRAAPAAAVAAVALLGILVSSAGANHSFPATYTGTFPGVGTMEFDVSADGSAVTRFAVKNFDAFPCATSIDSTTTGRIPISGTPHSFSTSDFTGTFDSTQHATGTFKAEIGSCTTPTRSWTATTTTPPPTHTLSVTKTGGGSGTITSSPTGITCGGTCSGHFDSGSSVTLTAAPASGSTFDGWSGGGCSGTGTCHVTMSSDQSVTATFGLAPPDTKITKAKIDQGKDKATFEFKGKGGTTGFQCQLGRKSLKDEAPAKFKSCSSPKTYKDLSPGKYTFEVRAKGPGGTDPTPAKDKFKIEK